MGRIIVSVPYTGTRFLRERLGIKQSVHTYTPWNRLLEIIDGHEVITPLRDPQANWHSWARRWDYAEDYDQQIARYNMCWFVLHSLSLIKDIDFIPVDLPNLRDSRIQDWTPVGNEDAGNLEHYYNAEALYNLPMIQKYYGKK